MPGTRRAPDALHPTSYPDYLLQAPPRLPTSLSYLGNDGMKVTTRYQIWTERVSRAIFTLSPDRLPGREQHGSRSQQDTSMTFQLRLRLAEHAKQNGRCVNAYVVLYIVFPCPSSRRPSHVSHVDGLSTHPKTPHLITSSRPPLPYHTSKRRHWHWLVLGPFLAMFQIAPPLSLRLACAPPPSQIPSRSV